MDVTKAPPSNDIANLGVGTATHAAAASQSSATAGASTASNSATTVAATADRVDIQPLDVAAALQILIAEVRAELALPGATLLDLPSGAPMPASGGVTPGPAPSSESVGLALLESQTNSSPDTPELSAVMPRQVGPQSAGGTASGAASPGAAGAGVDAATGGGLGGGAVESPLPGPPFVAPAPSMSAGVGPPGVESPAIAPPWTGLPWTGLPGMGPPGTDPLWTAPPGLVPGPPLTEPPSDDGDMDEAMIPAPLVGRWPLPASVPGLAAGLDSDLAEPSSMLPNARLAMPSALTLMSSPAQASPVLMRMFLQAVPREVGNPAAWFATVNQLESTLQSALDRAVATVEQWHDVPQAVVDAARETRGLVVTQLGDEALSPLWLRPEWMWLSPHMERFRRRRRLARRGLSDPDLWPVREDEGREHQPAERKSDR